MLWLLDHRVVLFLIFWGTSTLFCTVAVSVCTTNSARMFLFYTCQYLFLMFLILAFLKGVKLISHCSSDLHFPEDEWCWASFHMCVGHLYVFGEMFLTSSDHFFIGVFVFLGIELCQFFIIWILTLYKICHLQMPSLMA